MYRIGRIVVSGKSKKGDRNYFEDLTLGKFEKNNIFLAVFDEHCGREAAVCARDNLWDYIKSMKEFYSDKPEEVVEAMKKGFKKTQEEMLDRSPFLLYAAHTLIDSLETDDVTRIKCQKLIIKVAVCTPTHIIDKLYFFHLMKYKLYCASETLLVI